MNLDLTRGVIVLKRYLTSSRSVFIPPMVSDPP